MLHKHEGHCVNSHALGPAQPVPPPPRPPPPPPGPPHRPSGARPPGSRRSAARGMGARAGAPADFHRTVLREVRKISKEYATHNRRCNQCTHDPCKGKIKVLFLSLR